jgi:cobalt-zinc-cadmium efflux system protein
VLSGWERHNSTIDGRRRALLIALAANAAFFVVEIVGGFLFDSLAVLADATHMLSDVFALAIAYAALRFAQRPPTERHTYGFGRTEVLVAQVNAVLLLMGAIVIGVESVRRLSDPPEIAAAGVIVIGVLGLVVNVVSARVVATHAHGNLNMRGALWHLIADAFGSLAVIVAGLGAAMFGAEHLDPIASLLISVLVVFGAWRLLRDATLVLLEAVPAGLDAGEVRTALCAESGVETVHHLHLWTTGSENAALSAHIVLGGELSLHDAQLRAGELKRMLVERFGIEHATLEVECHTCIDDETHVHRATEPHTHSH